jgi:hypothetical protein
LNTRSFGGGPSNRPVDGSIRFKCAGSGPISSGS